ncbi:MAG: glycine dehydrogenase, partial [Gammaproteobacteria bacterium]|nr:glycine dehydrogenase [Gammaproteobacteria bacterium]
MDFVPHTSQQVQAMLKEIGIKSTDQLFDEIPTELQNADLAGIQPGISEQDMQRKLSGLARQDETGPCFMGAGCYDHYIPAAVWDVATRGEFYTAYTPYQAEASQGALQLLY